MALRSLNEKRTGDDWGFGNRTGAECEKIMANTVARPLGGDSFKKLAADVSDKYNKEEADRRMNEAFASHGRNLILQYWDKNGREDSDEGLDLEGIEDYINDEPTQLAGFYEKDQDRYINGSDDERFQIEMQVGLANFQSSAKLISELESIPYASGSYVIRQKLKGVLGEGDLDEFGVGSLDEEMDKVRAMQTELDPAHPNREFARELIAAFNREFSDLVGVNNDYEFRFYSAVDTVLDYAGGFDCWVELVDKKSDKPLWHYKIDLTADTNDSREGAKLADHTFRYKRKFVRAAGSKVGEIDPQLYEFQGQFDRIVQRAKAMKRSEIKKLLNYN